MMKSKDLWSLNFASRLVTPKSQRQTWCHLHFITNIGNPQHSQVAYNSVPILKQTTSEIIFIKKWICGGDHLLIWQGKQKNSWQTFINLKCLG